MGLDLNYLRATFSSVVNTVSVNWDTTARPTIISTDSILEIAVLAYGAFNGFLSWNHKPKPQITLTRMDKQQSPPKSILRQSSERPSLPPLNLTKHSIEERGASNSPLLPLSSSSPYPQIALSRKCFLFRNLTSLPENIPTSGHKIQKMSIRHGKDQRRHVWFKHCNTTDYPPEMAQIEVAATAAYRVIRGRNFADGHLVCNDNGDILGSASYDIPGFTPFKLPQNKEDLNKDDLVNLAEELVARWQYEEDDFHPQNVGSAAGIGLVGIDPGMSFYTITSRYCHRNINGILSPPATNSFPQTMEDIENFPNIQHAQPCYWPTKIPGNLNFKRGFENIEGFRALSKDKIFMRAVYLGFLKVIVREPKVHSELMSNNFKVTEDIEELSVGSRELLSELNQRIETRRSKTVQLLVSIEEFRQFIIEDKKAFHEIFHYFSTYNETIGRDEGITFGEEYIFKSLESLIKKCLCKDLTLALIEIGENLRGVGKKTEQETVYREIYNSCLDFEKSALNSIGQEIDAFNLSLDKVTEKFNSIDLVDTQIEDLRELMLTYRRTISSLSKRNKLIETSCSPVRDRMELRDVEFIQNHLGKGVINWLNNPLNKTRMIQIVKETLAEYQPTGSGSLFGVFNPKTYTRTRGEELTHLMTELEDPAGKTISAVTKFIGNGAWNQTWSIPIMSIPLFTIADPSANVLLINKICLATIGQIRDNLSLDQMENLNVVKVCSSRNTLVWDPIKIAQIITEDVSISEDH